MNNDQFIRYKALDRCFRDYYGSYTIGDLVDVCSKAVGAFHGDMTRKVSQRTVEKDIEDLRFRYDIELNDKARLGHKKIYKYADTSFSLMQKLLADGELEQMMLQNVLDSLSLYDDMPQYKWLYVFIQQRINGIKSEATSVIEFQNNADLLGMEHFDTILNAILKKQSLEITYRKYHGDSRQVIVFPYLLKQFNDRWFLIAHTQGYEKLSNYAIDRIHEINFSNVDFLPLDIDLQEYYENVIGVTKTDDKPVEQVLLKISRARYPYLETKPIHSSQTLINSLCSDDHKVIRLRVQVNNELEAKILSLGEDVEVLQPESLRASIQSKIRNLYRIYEDKNVGK